jgi:parallel beta-helix repeat protein
MRIINFKPSFFYTFLILVTIIQSCSKDSSPVQPQMKLSATSSLTKSFDAVATVPTTATGSILREEWDNVTGNDVSEIPVSATPTSTSQYTSLEGPVNDKNEYGDRMRGYIYAPQTGNYTFYIAGDDAAQLWLSTSTNPANKVLIASTLSYTDYHQFNKFSSQQSVQIKLQAGQAYYIEVLHKQGAGGANLTVEWKLPDNTVELPIPGKRLSPYTTTTTSSSPTLKVSQAIFLTDQHDITISGLSINGGSVPPIFLSRCYNVTITGNKLVNSTDVGIHLYECYNINVTNNYISNVSCGVYAEQTTNGGIVVTNNQFLNMQGPFPRGQFVQFNNVNGANNSVSNNKCQENPGQSLNSQEGINMYKSNGTPSSQIIINANWILGGGPGSASGGLQLGDSGGSYIYASNNIIVNPGQMGIAISGGNHISAVNNQIYAKSQYFTNVGIVVYDGIPGQYATSATVSGNQVNFTNSNNYLNNAWLAPGEATPTGWNGNGWGANINASILPASIVTAQ